MAAHVRQCACCKAGRECDEAVAIIGGYSLETLVDALAYPQKAVEGEARREYRRKWMKRHREQFGQETR